MYPTLYHFFFDVFGSAPSFLKAIPMFGFWVGIAFIVGSWLGVKELKRKEAEGLLFSEKKTITVGKPASMGDYISNGVIGFILGFKLIYIFYNSEVTENFPSFIMSGKGSVVGGVIVAIAMVAWKYRESKKNELPEPKEEQIDFHPHEHMSNITMLSVVSGILGAVIFGTLEKPHLISEFFAGEDANGQEVGFTHLYNGLTVYGGVILAVIANVYYFWKNKLNAIQYLDALGPLVLLAYGIGRIGCHMSGDGDWGIENLEPKPGWMGFLPDWMWAYDYPNNVNGEGIPITDCIYNDEYCNKLPNPVYPTAFYEMIMSGLLFAGIWSVRKIIKIPFIIFSLYVLCTGLERLLIEQIRVNTKYGSGYTQAEIISIALILIGIGLGVFAYLQFKKKQNG